MVDETAAVVGVLVTIVVIVLALVVTGFWIYLCCGHKRDKSKTPPIRPPRVSLIDNESQVSDANTGITRSKTRFSQGDGMSVDDRGFFLSPIYTKPTVRKKQKLFHSQPDLNFQRNVSHSIGDLMASEGQASHYQLSLDDEFPGNELEVDENLFEIEKQSEGPQSTTKLDFDVKEESLQETTETTMTLIQPATNSQNDKIPGSSSETTSRGSCSQVSLQVEEDNDATTGLEMPLLNKATQASKQSNNESVSDDDHSVLPEEPIFNEEQQQKEKDIGEEHAKNEEEQLEEKNVEMMENKEEGTRGKNDLNHYSGVLNTLIVPGLQDDETRNETEVWALTGLPPGSSPNTHENNIIPDMKTPIQNMQLQDDTNEKEEEIKINKDGSKSREIKMSDLDKLKEESYDLIYPSVSDSTLPESITSLPEEDSLKSSSSSESETKLVMTEIQELNSSVPIQQENISTSNKEDITEELIETTSLSCVAELREKFQQIASIPNSTLDTSNIMPLKYSLQKALKSGIDTSGSESSLGNGEEYQGSPLVRRYNEGDENIPSGYFGINTDTVIENSKQSDDKREQQKIRDIHSSDSDTKTSSEEEMLIASKPNLDLSEIERKTSIGVSPLVNVSYKAENSVLSNVSSLTDTDTGDESDELMHSTISKPVRKQAILPILSTVNNSSENISNGNREKEEFVTETFSDSENDLSESDIINDTPKFSPPLKRLRKVTPHPDIMEPLSDLAKYKKMHQPDTATDKLSNTPAIARTSLTSIPEEEDDSN